MSAEQNKSIVRRWIEEGWNKGNLAVIDQVYAPNYVQHEPAPAPVTSSEALKQYVGAYKTAFPDLHFTIEDMIAEGDRVVVRQTFRGTHQGDFMGIAPTGKQVTMTEIEIFRVVNGKGVENWTSSDDLGLLQQLSVVPSTE